MGTPQTPVVCPIGRLQGRYRTATEFPFGLRPPRNRCGVRPTSPVGPRAESYFFFVGGSLCRFHRRMEFDTKLDGSIPLTGRQPKPDNIPAPDQIPGGTGGSVAAQRQILSRPIGQKNGGLQGELGRRPKRGWPGPGFPQRFFRPLLGVQPVGLSLHRRPQGIQMRESGPVGDKTAPRATAGPFGNPGVWGRVGPNNKHQGSGVEPPLAGQGAPLLVMSTYPPGYGTPSPAEAPPAGRPRSR